MTIELRDKTPGEKDKFVTQHYVRTHTTEGLELYTLTGVVILDWKAKTGSDWRREDLILRIKVPRIPKNKALKLVHWAPFLTLNAIANDRSAQNAGWALDWFSVANPREQITDQVKIKAQIAGRDSDGWIYRIGYNITLLGSYDDLIEEVVF